MSKSRVIIRIDKGNVTYVHSNIKGSVEVEIYDFDTLYDEDPDCTDEDKEADYQFAIGGMKEIY